MKALGIDVGSLTTKAVILENNSIMASTVIVSSDEAESSARLAMDKVLGEAGISSDDDIYVVSTGVGGKRVSFGRQSKSITTCLARGSFYLFPSARMIIDMGAESSTIIKVNNRGRVVDWANQDKCAAGTGIFLQQMAKLMNIPLEEMSMLSFTAKSRPEISNTCAVFAESEVISHVHREPPTPREDIIAGIYSSVVSRIIALCKRVGIEGNTVAVGGVALNSGLVEILKEELGVGVMVPESPQIVAALGAAVIAGENIEKGLN